MLPSRSQLPPKPPKKTSLKQQLNPLNEQNYSQPDLQNNRQNSEDEINFNQQASPTWDQFFDEKKQIEISNRGKFQIYCAGFNGPVVMCIHGGGYTGLTWALLAKKLKNQCQVIAPDLRGHGMSSTKNDADLSKDTISEDIVDIFNCLFPDNPPPVILIGHSMGGAMAVWVTHLQNTIPSLQGVVVLDVVEGTAIASLNYMIAILDKRPKQFSSIQKAIAWAVQSGQYKNQLAAQLSIPSQLTQVHYQEGYVWRTDLYNSQKYWRGWYEGLSEAFLNVKVPKILILAGTDRLDKTLIIGQMQGKFQQVMLPAAGHAIHEDEVEKVADILLKFLTRYKMISACE